jgi:hypothetical protein
MNEKFAEIKQSYSELHAEFLKTNPLLVKYMERGIWAPSLSKEIFKIFKKFQSKEKILLDLGSGDGLVVMIASLFFEKAVGVEFEKEFYDHSLEKKKQLKITNVDFIYEDFYNIDFGKYDILFIAPDKEFTLRLENKIENELTGTLIVYSSIFQPKTLKLSQKFETAHFEVFIYENKAKKVAGS